jgi:hypothetical protein
MTAPNSRPLGLRDVHDRVGIARADVAIAQALIGADTLGGRRLTVALEVLNDLLRDLEHDGLST